MQFTMGRLANIGILLFIYLTLESSAYSTGPLQTGTSFQQSKVKVIQRYLQTENNDENLQEESLFDGIYKECLAKLSFSCLQKKVLLFVDRLTRSTSFKLTDYLTVVRNNPYSETAPEINENDLNTRLPRNLKEQEDALNTLLEERINRFFRTHSLRFTLPGSGSRDLKDNSVDLSLDKTIGTGE